MEKWDMVYQKIAEENKLKINSIRKGRIYIIAGGFRNSGYEISRHIFFPKYDANLAGIYLDIHPGIHNDEPQCWGWHNTKTEKDIMYGWEDYQISDLTELEVDSDFAEKVASYHMLGKKILKVISKYLER